MWSLSVVVLGATAATGAAALFLAGWGLSNLGPFFQDPPRAVGLTVATLGAFLAAPGMRFRAASRTEAKGQEWIAISNLLIYAVALWLFPFLDARRELATFFRVDWSSLRWIGTLLFIAGQGFMVWAIHTLGRFFTAKIGVLPGHQLIETGPYALLRHPFYTGVFLTALGFPAIFGFWVGFASAIVLLPLLIFRMNVEERYLEAEFGEAYQRMKERTWRLIPYVY